MNLKRLSELKAGLRDGKSIFDYKLRATYYDSPLADEESLKTYFENVIRCEKNWEYIDGYCEEENSTNAIYKLIKDSLDDKFDIVLVKSNNRIPTSKLGGSNYALKYCGSNYVSVLYKLNKDILSCGELLKNNIDWKLLLFEPIKLGKNNNL